MNHWIKNKRALSFSLFILFFLMLNPVSFEVQFVSAQGYYELSVSTGNPYYLKGETGQITIQSNASTSINLKIYDPQNKLLYNLNRVTNSTGFNILNFPIQQSVLYGDYRAVATAPDNSICTIWFSVPDAENWSPTSFPFVKEHKGLTHTIFGNKTLTVTSSRNESISITMPDLPDSVDIDCFSTNDVFVARFRHAGLGLAVDMSFLYIYQGAKLLINGTFNDPRDFSFEFASPRQIKNALHSMRDGNLVFDWSDLVKHANHFSYDHETKKLTVSNLPETFSIDPTIFEDGFESGDFSAWTGTNTEAGCTTEVISTDPHHGTYHAHFETDVDGRKAYVYKTVAEQTTIHSRIYMKIKSFPASSGDHAIGVSHEGTDGVTVTYITLYSTDGTNWYLRFHGRDGASYTRVVGSTLLSIDVWYAIEIKTYIHATVGEHRLYLDGSEEVALTDKDTDNYGNITKSNVGIIYCTVAANIYVDCVVVADTYIGEEGGVNNVPVNDNFSFTDMDDTNNIYAQKQYYTAQYNVSDADGFADIDYAEWSINQSATVRATFRFDEDTATWSIQVGSAQWAIDSGNCANVSSGNYLNMTFKFTAKFNVTEESNIDINCYVIDDEPESDTDTMQTDYADIVMNLVVSGFTCDDNRGDLSQSLTFTGIVYYANNPSSSTATTFYPPDVEFTAVHVYDSGDNDKGNDTSVVNGAFSVSFNAPASVGLETYNTYIDMADAEYTDAEESPIDTYISDQIVVYWWDANDTRLDWNNSSEIRLRAVLDYDEHALGSGDTVNINGTLADWDAGNSWFQTDEDYGSSVEYLYSVSSASEDTYGITSVNHNVTRQTVNWDRVSVAFSVDDTTPDNDEDATFTVALTYESDSTSVGSFTYDINRNETIFKDDYSSATFTDNNSDTVYIYDFNHTAVSDLSNGVLTWVDDSDITVTWTEAAIEYATRGEILAAAMVASLIFIPLLMIIIFAARRRR